MGFDHDSEHMTVENYGAYCTCDQCRGRRSLHPTYEARALDVLASALPKPPSDDAVDLTAVIAYIEENLAELDVLLNRLSPEKLDWARATIDLDSLGAALNRGLETRNKLGRMVGPQRERLT